MQQRRTLYVGSGSPYDADVGAPIFPTDVKTRAIARRKIREADEYVAQSMKRLVERVLFTPREQ